MYILTNRLVNLREGSLPLPWYHRAPLGLMSGTNIHVALQARAKTEGEGKELRPFGDLIVSVIDPENWPLVSEISAFKTDQPGLLAKVYDKAPPLNIVFAEAVTVDGGSRHDARLILEPYYRQFGDEAEDLRVQVHSKIEEIKAWLLEEQQFGDADDRLIHDDDHELVWEDEGRIEEGWVKVEGLEEAIAEQAAESKAAASYDQRTAVISADTERRILRYVFPRKHAVSVSIKHRDRPGVMAEIAKALAGRNLNILSSLLRRGSTSASKAEVVFVAEPKYDAESQHEVEDQVREALKGLAPRLRLKVDVSGPLDPEDVLYPRRPHEIAVRPSKSLESEILAVKRTVPRKMRPVFISRRFVDPNERYGQEVVGELRRALEANGCFPLEALPRPGGFGPLAPDAIKAMMWASEAGVQLVIPTDDERDFSVNLSHESGFMQGLGKPLLPLVQKNCEISIFKHANFQGLPLGTFSKENALKKDMPDSIASEVAQWIRGSFPMGSTMADVEGGH
jgi:predicted amino acid-binding ACT domain protein